MAIRNLTLKIFIFGVLLLPLISGAQEFTPLTNVPGLTDVGSEATNIGAYVSALYTLSIAIAALLAVVKIIHAGVKYMLTDIAPAKGDAKKDIQGALVGLLIVISAVLVLRTINPELIELNVFGNADRITPDIATGSLYSSEAANEPTGGPINIEESSDYQIEYYINSCMANGGQYRSWTDANNNSVGECIINPTEDRAVVISNNSSELQSQRDYCHEQSRTYSEQPLPSGETRISCDPRYCDYGIAQDQNFCNPYPSTEGGDTSYLCDPSNEFYSNCMTYCFSAGGTMQDNTTCVGASDSFYDTGGEPEEIETFTINFDSSETYTNAEGYPSTEDSSTFRLVGPSLGEGLAQGTGEAGTYYGNLNAIIGYVVVYPDGTEAFAGCQTIDPIPPGCF